MRKRKETRFNEKKLKTSLKKEAKQNKNKRNQFRGGKSYNNFRLFFK